MEPQASTSASSSPATCSMQAIAAAAAPQSELVTVAAPLPRVPIPRSRHVNPLTRAQSTKPRPRTSTERGQQYRAKRKVHETVLKQQIKELREEIDRLWRSRSLLCQKALLTRSSPHGSLVLLTRELYTILKHGLEVVDADTMSNFPISVAARKLSAAQYKESFLQRVLDPEVVMGDLIGVEAVINQWRRQTQSYSKFQLEIDGVDTATGSDENPIVAIYTTLHARFSRERIAGMFPYALHYHEDLVEKLVDKDLEFQWVSRFQFSERSQILTYMLDINFVETLVRVLGSASDVAELMSLSLVTPHATLMDEYCESHDGNLKDGYLSHDDGVGEGCSGHYELQQRRNQSVGGDEDEIGGHGDEDLEGSPERVKFSVRYLLSTERDREQNQQDDGVGSDGNHESLVAAQADRDSRQHLPRRRPPWLSGEEKVRALDQYEQEEDGSMAQFVSF